MARRCSYCALPLEAATQAAHPPGGLSMSEAVIWAGLLATGPPAPQGGLDLVAGPLPLLFESKGILFCFSSSS